MIMAKCSACARTLKRSHLVVVGHHTAVCRRHRRVGLLAGNALVNLSHLLLRLQKACVRRSTFYVGKSHLLQRWQASTRSCFPQASVWMSDIVITIVRSKRNDCPEC